MKVEINIECETIKEFNQHLTVLKTQLQKEMRRLALQWDDEFPEVVNLDDDNCYGAHSVTVKPEQ